MNAKLYLNERDRIVEEYETLIKQHRDAIESLLLSRDDELRTLENNVKKDEKS